MKPFALTFVYQKKPGAMRRMDILNKDVLRKNYRVYKGYSVKIKTKTEDLEQHYVVPWELAHEDCKKPFC